MKSIKRASRRDSRATSPIGIDPVEAATILHRRYVEELRPEITSELFVRVEHGGRLGFFPLSTNQRAAASRQAAVIRRVVQQAGWPAATARFVREFTLAIFWLPNPLTCTYTSLFTRVTAQSFAGRAPARRVRVILYEPDEPVRWGLEHWLNQLPGYECVAVAGNPTAFFRSAPRVKPDLALFNEPPCAPASEHFATRLATECPGLVGFPYGIYHDSEHAWYSVTGVDGGYYYRRRGPAQMLDPIAGLWAAQSPTRDSVEAQIRHHIQTLFGLRAANPEPFPGLTKRERDVLTGLRHGHTDKSLATLLDISVWTVHTHMKSLFDKLGVHTRAEAVAKYFEK